MLRPRRLIMLCLVMMFCLGSMASASNAGMARKIVLFHEDVSNRQIRKFIKEWKPEGASLFKSIPFVNGIILNVPDRITSEKLADDDRVLSVENDQEVELQAIRAAADGGSADGGSADGGSADGGSADGGSTQFIKSVPDVPEEDYRSWAFVKLHDQNYDPENLMELYDKNFIPKQIQEAKGSIKIAIFDTGVEYRHKRIDGVVKGGIDLVNLPDNFSIEDIMSIDDDIPVDDNGHGTHVIGLVAGRNVGLGTDFYLYAVKVLDQYAMGDLSTIILGLQWAVANEIDIVNMSIAFRKDSPAVRKAVQTAHEAGMIMVASAGNHSNWDLPDPNSSADGGSADGGSADGGSADGGSADGGSGNTESSSDLPWYSVMYPARYPEVIAVGSSDAYGDMTGFTNFDDTLDILAPGTDIVSSDLGNGFGSCSGTSMSAPIVSAAIAMMIAYDQQLDSNLTSMEQIKSILKETADPTASGVGDLNLIGALEGVDILNNNN